MTAYAYVQYDSCMNIMFSRIAEQFGLTLIIQFGSTVKGSRGPMSDVDVFMHGSRELAPEEEAGLRAALAEALAAAEERIDPVFLRRANALLAYEALWHGKLLWGDVETLHELQVRAWKRLQEERKFAGRRRAFIQAAIRQPSPAV